MPAIIQRHGLSLRKCTPLSSTKDSAEEHRPLLARFHRHLVKTFNMPCCGEDTYLQRPDRVANFDEAEWQRQPRVQRKGSQRGSSGRPGGSQGSHSSASSCWDGQEAAAAERAAAAACRAAALMHSHS